MWTQFVNDLRRIAEELLQVGARDIKLQLRIAPGLSDQRDELYAAANIGIFGKQTSGAAHHFELRPMPCLPQQSGPESAQLGQTAINHTDGHIAFPFANASP